MLSKFVVGAISRPRLFIILVNLLLLLVGMFLEAAAAILIFTPILLPIATTFGFDPVHFGVIMVVNLAMGVQMRDRVLPVRQRLKIPGDAVYHHYTRAIVDRFQNRVGKFAR